MYDSTVKHEATLRHPTACNTYMILQQTQSPSIKYVIIVHPNTSEFEESVQISAFWVGLQFVRRFTPRPY